MKPALRILPAIAAIAWGSAARAGPEARPNVILIVSDNQGYRDLGCCGDPDVVTPNLDRIAAEGVRATTFYVTSPACTPSRGSILTGQYPQRNGLYDQIINYEATLYSHRFSEAEYAVSPEMTLGLDVRDWTLAQMMRSSGYATAAIGKWDSGRAMRFRPLQRGFDYFYGFLAIGIDNTRHDHYGIPSLFRNNERIDEPGWADELFTHEAVSYVLNRGKKPFFLYLAYAATAGEGPLGDDGDPDKAATDMPPKRYVGLYPKLDPRSRRTRALAEISCMDDGIGRIVEALRQAGIERNTFIIYFSDNGWGEGTADCAPFRAVGTQIDRVSEGGLRPPFVACWPGVIPPHTVTDEFLSSLEIFPTLAGISGARLPEGLVLDGFDMLPVLQGKARSSRQEMFWQIRDARAARVGNYKWVDMPKLKGLFDLSLDPSESHDLSREQPDRLAAVQARWREWRKQMDDAAPRGPFRDY